MEILFLRKWFVVCEDGSFSRNGLKVHVKKKKNGLTSLVKNVAFVKKCSGCLKFVSVHFVGDQRIG